MTIFAQIIKLLDESGLEFSLSEHEAVRTSQEAARVRGAEMRTGAKSMVLKANRQYYLFVLPADKRINWKLVKEILKVKEIRFATEEEAEEVTKVKMGSVPPFGNVLNLPTYFDISLLENEFLNFNPGSRIHSIQMKSEDLVSIVKPEMVKVAD